MPEPNLRLIIRSMPAIPNSYNKDTRSLRVGVASENPVKVWDWERGLIDEVLLSDGMDPVDQVPLLDAHNRSSIDCMQGSIRDFSSTNEIGRASCRERV